MCLRSHALAFAAFGRQLECLLCCVREKCVGGAPNQLKFGYEPSRTSVLSSLGFDVVELLMPTGNGSLP